MTILGRLAAELEFDSARNSNAALDRVSSDPSRTVAELQFATGAERPDAGAVGAYLLRNLSGQIEKLSFVEALSGDARAEMPAGQPGAPNAKKPQPEPAGLLSGISGVSVTAGSFWALAVLVVLMFLTAAFGLNLKRRDVRRICRTPVLIVQGDQRTVTHIVDMSRRGMKIEAAKEAVGSVWVDLYFCGHKLRGEIVWRSADFAGIRFKTRVSQQTLD